MSLQDGSGAVSQQHKPKVVFFFFNKNYCYSIETVN